MEIIKQIDSETLIISNRSGSKKWLSEPGFARLKDYQD
jgi:hypothetical protein